MPSFHRAKGIDEERERRQRSHFQQAVNHRRERTVFYSTRHGHGTTLAAAGVPEKDIATSMHHACRATTVRRLHAGRDDVARSVAALPDLPYPEPLAATGTDDCWRNACATGRSYVQSAGVSGGFAASAGGGVWGVECGKRPWSARK